MDKYHPGYFGKVGMRYFHKTKNQYHRKIMNVDRLWTMVSDQSRLEFAKKKDIAPVIDTVQAVSWVKWDGVWVVKNALLGIWILDFLKIIYEQTGADDTNAFLFGRVLAFDICVDIKLWLMHKIFLQGFTKVLGKGRLPDQPVILKARSVSYRAEKKIKDAGGVVVLITWIARFCSACGIILRCSLCVVYFCGHKEELSNVWTQQQ
jgi:ribosomal protein L15